MTQSHRALRLSLTYLIAALLLAGMFGLAVGSVRRASPTLYEGRIIARGWAYLRTGHLLPIGHPPLSSIVSGLAIQLEPGLPDPAILNGWVQDDAAQLGESLLWHTGINTGRAVFLARFPFILLGLMLGALVFRWGHETYGLWSGLIALALVAFSPTMIAYSQLAVTDFAAAAFSLAALYGWGRCLRRRSARWAAIGGAALGLALASDFTALPLAATLVVMTAWHIARRGRLLFGPGQAMRLGLFGLLGLGALWAATGFNLRPAGAGGYLSEMTRYLSIAASDQRPYLLGRFSPAGWWYEYPVLLATKMTLPHIILMVLALTLVVMRGLQRPEWEFIFPGVAHLALVTWLLPSPEIRHALFVIPLIALFCARSGAGAFPSYSWRRMIAAGLIAAAHIPACLLAYPYYLAYFNAAVGGSSNGFLIAAGSNVDWGQSLSGLGGYVRNHNIGQVYLSTYGAADPAAYGIKASRLPSWPPGQAETNFYPLNPAPGIYAIGASNLAGVAPIPLGQDTYAYFRDRRPLAGIGHSMFLYGVPPETHKLGGWLAQCASPDPAESEQAFRALTGLPDLNQFYFDCRQSLAIPQGAGWVVFPPDIDPIVDLGAADYVARSDAGLPRYRVWRVGQPPAEPPSTIALPQVLLPLPIADHLELVGYQVNASTLRAGETLVLRQWWRIRQPPPPPVSLSARLVTIDTSGAQKDILTGDALGLRAEDWQPGMTLIQQNAFALGADFPPGDYWIAVGLFDVTTGRHFPVAETADQAIDRIILQKITVTASAR